MERWIRYVVVISAMALVSNSGSAEESCLSVSDIEFSTNVEASEVDWQAVVTNECAPEVNVMLEVQAVDGSKDAKKLYWIRVAETIEQRGRKLVEGNFFLPNYVMSELEDVDVTIGQVTRSY